MFRNKGLGFQELWLPLCLYTNAHRFMASKRDFFELLASSLGENTHP